MSRYPTEVDARVASRLVIANGTFKSLYEPLILCTSTVVEAESIVNDATVSVDINVATVVVSSANFYTYTNRNGLTNVVGGSANSSTVGMNIIAVIVRVNDDNARASRAGVRLRRAVGEHVSSVVGQTLKVSRNHLPGRSFLQGGARGAADVSFEGELVPKVNNIARVVGVEEGGVDLTDTRKTVLDDPVTPTTAVLAMASLRPRTPDSISKESEKGSGVGRDVGSSANQMVEVVGRRCGKVQLIVNVGNSSKHRRAVAKDMRGGIVRVRAEPTAKVGTMSTRIGEDHVVSDRNNIKPRIRRDPGRRPSMVA